MLLNVAAKAILGRTRPAFWHSLAPKTTPSFPSVHAMESMALVLTLFLLVRPARALAGAGGLLFVPGVGWSRVCLGVHYPSDVAAGWVASTAWVLSVHLLFSPYLAALARRWERLF